MAEPRIVLDGMNLDAPGLDARNAMLAHRERTKQLAKYREAYCRELLKARMPRRLHWLIDHPRLLKRVLRVVKRWEPTLIIVNLKRPPLLTGGRMSGRGAAMASSPDGAAGMARTWIAEQEARGKRTSGLVFTYTDPSGLPAEVYGPVA